MKRLMLLSCSCQGLVTAAEPVFETTRLFAITLKNKPNYRIDAKTLLFSSPASPFRQKEHLYGRYNLTIRIGHHDGETWSAGKTIWPHPGSYSDIVVLDAKFIGCIYERAEKGSDHYWDESRFARFNLELLTNGRESTP